MRNHNLSREEAVYFKVHGFTEIFHNFSGKLFSERMKGKLSYGWIFVLYRIFKWVHWNNLQNSSKVHTLFSVPHFIFSLPNWKIKLFFNLVEKLLPNAVLQFELATVFFKKVGYWFEIRHDNGAKQTRYSTYWAWW